MSEVHGIVYAYRSSARLGDLTRWRTNASLPFCGRYRLIDFALSSLSNAGVHSVGVIMQRDYQSLLDHLGSGKAWDLSRRSGGLHLLPPFGVNTRGDYTGTAEALNAVISYVRNIPESEIVLMPADIVCNLDLAAAIAQHDASGCGITAICRGGAVTGEHHRYLTDAEPAGKGRAGRYPAHCRTDRRPAAEIKDSFDKKMRQASREGRLSLFLLSAAVITPAHRFLYCNTSGHRPAGWPRSRAAHCTRRQCLPKAGAPGGWAPALPAQRSALVG